MKYNRTVKYKIKAVLNANDYKLEYTVKVKSSLLKELEKEIKYKLGYSTSNRDNYLSCTKVDISEIFTI